MKNHLIFSVLVAQVLTMTSCLGESNDNQPLPDAKPIILKAEYKDKIFSSHLFALDLFKTTVATSKGANLFISPYSVNTALNMAWNGTAGETATEMKEVLGNSGYTTEQINDYTKTLTDALLTVDPSTKLHIANSIWADNLTPFKELFVKTNKTWYSAEVMNVNFKDPETFKTIDRWCMKNTNDKIEKITEGMDPDVTKFALINAVYFNAKWKYKFNRADTHEENFTNASGDKVVVQMMNQREDFLYAQDGENWKMLRMPYGNQAFSMIVLMPYGTEPLDKMIEQLTIEKYTELWNMLRPYRVIVKLPKFKAEYSYQLHKEILPSMGLKHIFNSDVADMSMMSESSMYVNNVIHKTYIDVYEAGTEASAATIVSGDLTTAERPQPINFFADRPFIYSIVENSTGTILFMGRINNF